MLVLSVRTDKPDAEVGLFDGARRLDYEVWQAHRALAETIHTRIDELLKRQGKGLKDVEGIVCYSGPGSFTGLRIGLSVANALAYSLKVPIVGMAGEEGWLGKGLDAINGGRDDRRVMPEYGAEVRTTTPKK